ncbi:response regulator transcription factor [Fulvivirga sp. 29W222]|uniref:Response regulator transcription factor n=1 Tax=Fulvivirga marina TaxID=2494733 RepID=A0A937FW02_9BACT|nr:response regulator transcription factor [Fulvivirga marina]MBL6446002.1 response regulator transcription factor [Fulvivirga marina]
MITAIIVDDHPLFAEGLKAMFKASDGIEIVEHTKNGNELPCILRNTQVDLILMDIDMPIMDGIATMELLKKEGFNIPILMLTMHQSMRKIKNSLEKGAQGYILKDASKPELVEAITKTSLRQNYFHPKINDQVFDYFRGRKSARAEADELSEREREIIECLAGGMNTKAISEALHISEHTVKTHRRNIMYKLDVKTSAELVKLAIEKGIIDIG